MDIHLTGDGNASVRATRPTRAMRTLGALTTLAAAEMFMMAAILTEWCRLT